MQYHNLEHDQQYLAEYRKMLQTYASLVADHPERIDQLREVLKVSARLINSNRPEAITDFGKLAEELDAF